MWPAVRAAPGTAGGLPPGVTVFANARINYYPLNPAPHHECKNTCHRDSAATAPYRRTLGPIAPVNKVKKKLGGKHSAPLLSVLP